MNLEYHDHGQSNNRRITIKSVELIEVPADIPVQVMPPRPSGKGLKRSRSSVSAYRSLANVLLPPFLNICQL
jgi:hypothetical protein